MVDVPKFLNEALYASDLMQSYVEKAAGEIDKLAADERLQLLGELAAYKPINAEEAGAVAIMKHILEDK